MKFQKIKSIRFSIPEKPNEKHWIIVKFENGIEWMPALVDLGDILSKIGTCEDMKYSQGQGYKYTQKFIIECFTKKRREIEQLYNDQFNPNNLKYSK